MKVEKAEAALGLLLVDDKDLITTRIRNLEALANFKYNEYLQFAPGRFFLESLVTWLERIPKEHRSAAFHFVCERLIFMSRGDMYHFTKIAIAHKVVPTLLKNASRELQLPIKQRVHLAESTYFRTVQRSAIFFAMSDGARIDDFRRQGNLSNEQVSPNYDITEERWKEIAKEWQESRNKNLEKIKEEGRPAPPADLSQLWLVDDFAASGSTIIRNEDGKWKGKYPKFVENIYARNWSGLDHSKLQVNLLLYVITSEALNVITQEIERFHADRKAAGDRVPRWSIQWVQLLEADLRIGGRAGDSQYTELIDSYDVKGSYDRSIRKGGEDGHQKWGYKRCALPVVLFHNTPNNSIAPLWMYSDLKMPGLFPRVRRHWED